MSRRLFSPSPSTSQYSNHQSLPLSFSSPLANTSNNKQSNNHASRSAHSSLISPSHSSSQYFNLQATRSTPLTWSPYSEYSSNQFSSQNHSILNQSQSALIGLNQSQPIQNASYSQSGLISPNPNTKTNETSVSNSLPFRYLTSQLNNFALSTPPRIKSSISVRSIQKKIWSISDLI